MPIADPFTSLRPFPAFSSGPCPLAWPENGLEDIPDYSLEEIMEILWLGYEVNVSASMSWQRVQTVPETGTTYTWVWTASGSSSFVLCNTEPLARICSTVQASTPTQELADGTLVYSYENEEGSGIIGTFDVRHAANMSVGGGSPVLRPYQGSIPGNYRLYLYPSGHTLGDFGEACIMRNGSASDWIADGGNPDAVIGSDSAQIFGNNMPVFFTYAGFNPENYTFSLLSHSLSFTLGEKYSFA